MAWQLLAAALPAAAKVAGSYLQKPDRKDYQPQTDYMKKYLSYLRGRSANKEVLHMAMQPQLRAIGKQGRQMQRQVGYDVAKSGLEGSGIEAQMRLSAGAQTQEALSDATERAVAAQSAEDARIGEKSADLAARIEAEEKRAEQAYETAGRQWKRQMGADVLGLGASIVAGSVTQAGQAKEAAMLATRSGYFGDEANVQKMMDEGWTPEMFRQETIRMNQVMNNIMGGEDPETVARVYKQFTGRNLVIPPSVTTTADADGGVGAEIDSDTEPIVEAQLEEEIDVVEDQVSDVVEDQVSDAVADEAEIVPDVDAQEKADADKKRMDSFTEEREANIKAEAERYKKVKEEGGYPSTNIPPKQMVKDIRPVARKNPDGSESTVMLAQRDNLAYPTIFPKDPDNPSSDPSEWLDYSDDDDKAFAEASKRNEVFAFKSEKRARSFAEGSWKPKPKPKPKAKSEVKKAQIENVEQNKNYVIYNKKRTKTKRFRYTGEQEGDKYIFKSADNRTVKLTLEELNNRVK